MYCFGRALNGIHGGGGGGRRPDQYYIYIQMLVVFVKINAKRKTLFACSPCVMSKKDKP